MALRNKFEIKTYKWLRRRKAKFTYETERVPYILAGHYIPDFIIQTKLGKIYVECKGHLRREDKRKLVAVKKMNPHMDLRMLFYESKKTQIKWAEKIGIRYAIATIPREWLEGL